ncbi:hypothetical protein Sru01_42160 [Sphaerisporangium rufum]|uniref:Uncharacterized protein n=2 Tax=Sphaerisporangium rufum TaxID=1381558 RepID=A0A919R456_9ACTN|nr:hypothetical protein Sru01_42160 [Sphaerisporangium rufum]
MNSATSGDPLRITRELDHSFTGWRVWFGVATRRWWALAPWWCHERFALVEAGSSAELVLRMNRIELGCPFILGLSTAGAAEAVDRFDLGSCGGITRR